LAPWIISHFPPHRVYTESFGGGASVLLRKRRSHSEVYNDLDGDVVEFFRVLREPELASRLADLLALTPFARAEWAVARELASDPVERARRLLIRSQMGFGSDSVRSDRKTGFRSTTNRGGTVPSIDWSRYPREIPAFVARLSGVLIDQRDAVDVIREHDRADALHYVDPPYVHSTRSEIRGYALELDDDGHRRLAKTLRDAKGFVVLSGYDCDLYRELYGDWLRVDRRVTVFRQTPRVESLWLSSRTARALDASFLFGPPMPEE
jgi:DNA adenine methylase